LHDASHKILLPSRLSDLLRVDYVGVTALDFRKEECASGTGDTAAEEDYLMNIRIGE
jgi:hypothetical protein